ncbi:MAG TPA: hypothetical protein VFR31_14985 [Thermoanaerobaculia bacterium]|nr:hypothetical protein [Thermoanaerobaculia bacterium]
MGFLSRVPAVEEWLDEAAEEWSQLSDREYGDFWRRWREAFESRLSQGKPTARDVEAMARIERELPFEAVVFSAPGYDFLPSSTPDRAPLFAYRASRLTRIDRERCNSWDCILADRDLRFTCLYTHEIGSLGDPVFLEMPSNET